MTKVFITGATGNVGIEVIKSLQMMHHSLDLYAGVRDVNADKIVVENYQVKCVHFDFMDAKTYTSALKDCEVIFLLRPPQLSEVEKYFRPFIKICGQKGVKHIVFLSVQGVEKSKIIPHHKIEKLILDSQIPFTFLRPAYFMQNFSTTLRADLVQNRQIYLPAGNAKFTLIDTRDIAAVAAKILTEVSLHANASYELTNNEKLTFTEMAEIMSNQLGVKIKFVSPNLLSFFFAKREQKVPTMLILVMIMLHYFPRFQKVPEITEWVEKITHKAPTKFQQFVADNKKLLSDTTP